MPLLDHRVHACLRDPHLVKDEGLSVVDTESSRPSQLRLRFGAGFPMADLA